MQASPDHYAGVAPDWDAHAARVYGPIAAELVAAAPHPLRKRMVLDAGAGTGLAGRALVAAGARVLAVDLSLDMLRWRRASRPPAVVGDVGGLPLRDDAVDDAVAAFVLNHLPDPMPALRELARVTRPGGAVLATVYATNSRSAVRDLIDAVAVDHGFRWPQWYLEIKQVAAPRLGTAAAMVEAARAAGLSGIDVVERPVDVGLDQAEQLVDYRLGQAHCRAWLDGLSDAARSRLRADALRAVAPVMEPYRPWVVRLVGRT
jgi:SAM-dependent methyltransferase